MCTARSTGRPLQQHYMADGEATMIGKQNMGLSVVCMVCRYCHPYYSSRRSRPGDMLTVLCRNLLAICINILTGREGQKGVPAPNRTVGCYRRLV